ncbi:MAG TPA: hydroxylamine reductase [Clostridiales bacterium]|nr:hydroxylamine reductase [Clostridiales bacterium]
MENRMLCYQCAGAAQGKCCNNDAGVCGKTAETSYLQDVLTGALVGLAKASVHKSVDEEIQRLTVEGLCATAAHANFTDARLLALIDRVREAKKRFMPKYGDHNAGLTIPEDFDIRLIWQKSPDLRSLKSLLLFGIRGIASYAYQSWALGYQNKETATFFHKALIALSANHFKEDYFALLKEMGEVNLRAMELLDKAKNQTYGEPSPVEVSRIIDAGPFIVVSGHHYHDLMTILEQTADTGVNVYSHGELLPAHAYPAFRKYPHFKGHYGTGWQNQQLEFDHIPAALVFTSNCVMLPLPSYADRVFTCGTAGLPGIPHIDDHDFRPVLIRAIELNGAPAKTTFPGANGGALLKTGFGKKSLQTLGYKIAGAMTDGEIKHIFVIGGCDGFGEDRQFFTDIIHRLPGDAVVLTYGCCKFRFNDIENTAVGGVPRIVDVGQCGDLLQLIGAVEAIAAAAQCRVEELPLTWLLSWQEQRSMANLFSLFAADIHNVILGPKRPPFFTDAVLEAFAKEFNLSILMDEKTAEDETFKEETLDFEVESAKPAPTGEEVVTPGGEKFRAQETSGEVNPAELTAEADAATATLPDWAVSDDEEEVAFREEEADGEDPRTKKPQIPPEEIDQTPDFLLADDQTMESKEPGEAAEPKEAGKSTAAGTEQPPGPKITPETPPQEGDTGVPTLTIPKGKGVSGWQDPDENPSFQRNAVKKPYVYTPRQELKEVPAPPPIALPAGAGVSGFSQGQAKESAPLPMENMYSFAEVKPEIKIPKGKGVSGWQETDDFAFSAKKRSAADKKSDEKSSAKPWLENSLKELKASLDEDIDDTVDHENTAPPEADAEAQSTPDAPAPPDATAPKAATPAPRDTTAPEADAETELEATAATAAAPSPLLDEEERRAKPWLENSLQELKASLAEDEEAKKADGDKPWLAASLKQLKESIVEDGIEPASSQDTPTETVSSTPPAAAEGLPQTERKLPLPPKSWQDIVPGQHQAKAAPQSPLQSQPQPATETKPASEAPVNEAPQTWQKPPVVAKPWERDLQRTWQKPATVTKPWQQQQIPIAPSPAAEPTPGVYTQLPNLPLGNPRTSSTPAAATPNSQRYISRQPGPNIPSNAGISGYQAASYIPGQAPPAPPWELREVTPAPPAEIPYGAGVSGVHYRAEEPPLSPSYDPTYYDVPQKTPKINLPKGVGVSGWQNGQAPPDAAEALGNQAAAENREQAFTAADLLAFGDDTAPATAGADQVYRPGEGEELIATLGPDGKVILAVRNKNRS